MALGLSQPLTEMNTRNHTFTAHTEREQLGDQRYDGESNFNSGDGMGQMAQPWMFMMMMMI
jgi:hypothetical protein